MGILEQRVSLEGELVELACVITDPGAARQAVHADTLCETTSATLLGPSVSCSPLVSVFIALQDISLAMGPTILCPATHTPVHHDMLEDIPENDRASDATVGLFG